MLLPPRNEVAETFFGIGAIAHFAVEAGSAGGLDQAEVPWAGEEHRVVTLDEGRRDVEALGAPTSGSGLP